MLCVGYYVAGAQKGPTLDLSVEKMHDIMVEELVKGVSSEDSIKCGVIGEIGISWPIHGENSKTFSKKLYHVCNRMLARFFVFISTV